MSFAAPVSLSSPTGASLNLLQRTADGPAIGIVQVNHGLAEHAARYERFADFLAGKGFHTVVHDHRGHGATTAPDAPIGQFAARDGVGKVMADILAVHDHIGARHPGLPVIVFGHSMGGLIALNFVLRHPERAAALAVWNANVSAGLNGRLAQGLLAWEVFRLGSDVPSRLLPRLTFEAWGKQVPGHATLFDWLSRDEAEVAKYIADPLCGWRPSVSMWRDVFRLIVFGADDRNFQSVPKFLPVSIVGGGADPSTDNGKALQALAARMRGMGFSTLVSTIYPQTRHEGLNELNRDAIMADFADWATEAVSSGRAVTSRANVGSS